MISMIAKNLSPSLLTEGEFPIRYLATFLLFLPTAARNIHRSDSEMELVLVLCSPNLLKQEGMEGWEELELEQGHGDAFCVYAFSSCAWREQEPVL